MIDVVRKKIEDSDDTCCFGHLEPGDVFAKMCPYSTDEDVPLFVKIEETSLRGFNALGLGDFCLYYIPDEISVWWYNGSIELVLEPNKFTNDVKIE